MPARNKLLRWLSKDARRLASFFSIAVVSSLLVGCATSPSGSSRSAHSTSKRKSSLPKVPPKNLPGGANDNWRYLGTTQDNQIAVEINESSITPSSVRNNRYQDRKTIVNPQSFNYASLTPKYKYSLSWWIIDCQNQQYQISSSSIYDEYGNLLKNYNLKNETPPSAINSGTIAEMEYHYICLGSGRDLGY